MTIRELIHTPEDFENFLAENHVSFKERKACLEQLKSVDGKYFQEVDEQGRTRGLVKLIPLPWDSRILGVPCHRLQVLGHPTDGTQALLAEALKGAEGLVDTKIPSSDTHWLNALEQQGFEVRDTLVVFALSLAKPCPFNYSPEWAEGFEIRRADLADAEALYSLGRECFQNPEATPSRILTDPRIPIEKGSHFYGAWAANLVREEHLVTFVATQQEKLVGFLGLCGNPKEKSLRIPLNGVHPQARGRGLYQALLCHTMVFGNGQGYTSLVMGSHLAQEAMRHIWTKLGADLIETHYCLHFWSPTT